MPHIICRLFSFQTCGDAEYIAAFQQIVLPIAYEVSDAQWYFFFNPQYVLLYKP